MTFAGVENGKTGGAPGREQPSVWFNGAAQLRNVVAEHFAEAPGLEKIALHVDDQERALLRREREGVGFGREVYGFVHAPRRVRGRRQSEFATAPPKISGPLRSAGHGDARKDHAGPQAGEGPAPKRNLRGGAADPVPLTPFRARKRNDPERRLSATTGRRLLTAWVPAPTLFAEAAQGQGANAARREP